MTTQIIVSDLPLYLFTLKYLLRQLKGVFSGKSWR